MKGRVKKSFTHAFNGVTQLYREENNFRIQCIIALCVLIVSCIIQLSVTNFIAIIIVIGFVLALELTNAALERSLDAIEPRLAGFVKSAKDMMAGAVLVTSCMAVIVGVLIIAPTLFYWIAPLLRTLF